MTVEVCTTLMEHADHPEWVNYIPLLRAQRDSAAKRGHKHSVVTNTDLGSEFNQIHCDLGTGLMKGLIKGVCHRLKGSAERHLLFVDVDCLINRELDSIYEEHDFDLILTRRISEISPVNNGAMYVRRTGIDSAIGFFEYALSICKEHWGGDQEAISQAAMPVPMKEDGIGIRQGCTVKFVSMQKHNAVPKARLIPFDGDKYVLHFKGKTKEWMLDYARDYMAIGGVNGYR